MTGRTMRRGGFAMAAALLLAGCGDGGTEPGPETPRHVSYIEGNALHSVSLADAGRQVFTPVWSQPLLLKGFSWAPGGTRVALLARETASEVCGRTSCPPENLYTFDTASGEVRKLTQQPVDVSAARWSPRGDWIAFAAAPSPERDDQYSGALYRVGADGSGLVRLGEVTGQFHHVAWSPDGTRLAFVVDPRFTLPGEPEDFRYYVIGADGTGLRELAVPGLPPFPASLDWSPDGRTLLVGSGWNASGSTLHEVDVATGARTALLIPGLAATGAAFWSPDGQRLLVQGSAQGSSALELFVTARDGQGLRKIEGGMPASWRP